MRLITRCPARSPRSGAACVLADGPRDPARGATELAGILLPKSAVPAQVALVEALAQRRDPTAAPALLRHLSHALPEVGLCILKALGVIGDARCRYRVGPVRCLGSPSEQAAARQALVNLRRGRVTESMVGRSRPAALGCKASWPGPWAHAATRPHSPGCSTGPERCRFGAASCDQSRGLDGG